MSAVQGSGSVSLQVFTEPSVGSARPFRERFNEMSQEITLLEGSFYNMQETKSNYIKGIPVEDLSQTREEFKNQIEKCKESFESFRQNLDDYERAKDGGCIDRLNNRLRTITSELETLDRVFDKPPEQIRRRRFCCIATIVGGIVVAILTPIIFTVAGDLKS